MSSHYSQLYAHVVFAVTKRQRLLNPNWASELHMYIAGIMRNKRYKLMAINSVEDHMHMLISYSPDDKVSDIVRDVKMNSTRFINAKRWLDVKFQWQRGFSAFSVSKSAVSIVARYIERQQEHHSKARSSRDELIQLLDIHGVDYREEYIK